VSTGVALLGKVMTCSAAPSQWELKLSDDRIGYVRYRHQELKIGAGNTIDEAVFNAVPYELVAPFSQPSECTWDDVEPYVHAFVRNL